MIKYFASPISNIIKISTFTLLALTMPVNAAAIQVGVLLSKIEASKKSESGGDELYFSVTEYSNKTSPELYRVPDFPQHWLSAKLPQVKDVLLWQNELEDDEALEVVFSLIEHDMPPWNVDDHIGSIKLVVKRVDGKVMHEWSQPNYNDQTKVTRISKDYPLYKIEGNDSIYNIKLNFQSGSSH